MADFTFTTLSIEPSAQLRWSKDGGHVWSNWVTVKLGRTGDRYRRAIWRRIGLARDIMFEVQTADAVKSVMIGASIDIMPGDS